MIHLRNSLLALGLAAGTLVLGMSSPAGAAPGDVTNVCSTTRTPDGFVDVQWWNSASCGLGTFSPNAKQIKQLTGLPVGTVVNACVTTYPPNGWIQVSSYRSSNCRFSSTPSFADNAWQLKRVF